MHVLSMPPAFVLSQDQTLRSNVANHNRPSQSQAHHDRRLESIPSQAYSVSRIRSRQHAILGTPPPANPFHSSYLLVQQQTAPPGEGPRWALACAVQDPRSRVLEAAPRPGSVYLRGPPASVHPYLRFRSRKYCGSGDRPLVPRKTTGRPESLRRARTSPG